MSDLLSNSYRPDVVAEAARPPEFATIQARARARRRRRAGAAAAAAIVLAAAAAPLVGGWPWPGSGAPAGAGADEQFAARASAVIEAWQASGLAFTAGQGFLPRQELTTLTATAADKPGTFKIEDTFPSEATYQAYLAGRFRLAGSLSTAAPAPLPVTFDGGGASLTLPLAPAAAAYAALDRTDPAPDCAAAGCVALTVTGASLGSVPLHTSRGGARVPAWIFTVAELRAPVARVAIASAPAGTDVLRLPAELLPEGPGGPWAHAIEWIDAQPMTLRVHFTGGACDQTRTGRAVETAVAVVVGVMIAQAPGMCAGIGLASSVDVTLAAPLGQRVVLGLADGAPVELRPPG